MVAHCKFNVVGWSWRLSHYLGIEKELQTIITDKMKQGRINKAIELSQESNGYVDILEVQEWLKGKSIFVDSRIIEDRCINLKLNYK